MEEEYKELIAKRIPPGDRWVLVTEENLMDPITMKPKAPIEGLTRALNQYMKRTKFKGAYRLEPLEGALYIIKTRNVPLPQTDPERWDIYGEGE